MAKSNIPPLSIPQREELLYAITVKAGGSGFFNEKNKLTLNLPDGAIHEFTGNENPLLLAERYNVDITEMAASETALDGIGLLHARQAVYDALNFKFKNLKKENSGFVNLKSTISMAVWNTGVKASTSGKQEDLWGLIAGQEGLVKDFEEMHKTKVTPDRVEKIVDKMLFSLDSLGVMLYSMNQSKRIEHTVSDDFRGDQSNPYKLTNTDSLHSVFNKILISSAEKNIGPKSFIKQIQSFSYVRNLALSCNETNGLENQSAAFITPNITKQLFSAYQSQINNDTEKASKIIKSISAIEEPLSRSYSVNDTSASIVELAERKLSTSSIIFNARVDFSSTLTDQDKNEYKNDFKKVVSLFDLSKNSKEQVPAIMLACKSLQMWLSPSLFSKNTEVRLNSKKEADSFMRNTQERISKGMLPNSSISAGKVKETTDAIHKIIKEFTDSAPLVAKDLFSFWEGRYPGGEAPLGLPREAADDALEINKELLISAAKRGVSENLEAVPVKIIDAMKQYANDNTDWLAVVELFKKKEPEPQNFESRLHYTLERHLLLNITNHFKDSIFETLEKKPAATVHIEENTPDIAQKSEDEYELIRQRLDDIEDHITNLCFDKNDEVIEPEAMDWFVKRWAEVVGDVKDLSNDDLQPTYDLAKKAFHTLINTKNRKILREWSMNSIEISMLKENLVLQQSLFVEAISGLNAKQAETLNSALERELSPILDERNVVPEYITLKDLDEKVKKIERWVSDLENKTPEVMDNYVEELSTEFLILDKLRDGWQKIHAKNPDSLDSLSLHWSQSLENVDWFEPDSLIGPINTLSSIVNNKSKQDMVLSFTKAEPGVASWEKKFEEPSLIVELKDRPQVTENQKTKPEKVSKERAPSLRM